MLLRPLQLLAEEDNLSRSILAEKGGVEEERGSNERGGDSFDEEPLLTSTLLGEEQFSIGTLFGEEPFSTA